MPEPEGVVVRQRPLVGTHELLAHQPHQLRGIAFERLDGGAVEDRALDGAAGERRALGCGELVEPGGEKRADRGRHLDVAGRRVAHHRRHLLHEQRVALGRGEDFRTQRRIEIGAEIVQQRLARLTPQRLHEHRRRVQLPAGPARTAVQQLGPPHAEKQDRRSTAPVRDMLDQVEQGRLGPVQVVPDDDERTLGGRLLEQLADGERDLVRGRRLVAPEQDTQRPGDERRKVALLEPQLLHDLDDRPVRDPLAVGKTTALDDGRVHLTQELGR